jgi:hypothetical protein
MVCAWTDNVKRANVITTRNFPVARHDTYFIHIPMPTEPQLILITLLAQFH